MAVVPYRPHMTKMTMFIDEALLARVLRLTGLKTKTDAVALALRELERDRKLARFLKARKANSIDWKSSVDPAYDLMKLRRADMPPRYRASRGSR